MADKLVTVAEYESSMPAEMARQVLEDFGIRAVVVGGNFADLSMMPTLSLVKLQVLEDDADKAREILEEQEQGHEPEDYEVMGESGENEDLPDGGPDELDEPDEQEEK